MKTRWPMKAARIVPIVLAVGLVLGLIVMALWNALVPDLFHGPVVTYWQALGLLLLSRLLFFGGPGGRPGWRRDEARRRMQERWASMSPEDREKIRGRMRGRCGWDPDDSQRGGGAEAGVS
jgi:hypothetical protein